eukprot:XP_017945675.1 PREDICTED: sarcosine dehydrogenase, mitochondrial [Xenopus tropicalis]
MLAKYLTGWATYPGYLVGYFPLPMMLQPPAVTPKPFSLAPRPDRVSMYSHALGGSVTEQCPPPVSQLGKVYGVESYVLSPAQTKDLYPLMNVDDLYGTLYVPKDGTMDPAGTCTTLARASSARGAQVIENCPVTGIRVKTDDLGVRRVVAVETQHGTVETPCVVNCAGAWAPKLGQMAGVNVPLVAMHHAYVVTERIEGIQNMPNVRDHDASVYLRLQGDALSVGGYESNPIFWEKVSDKFAFGLFDLDWDVFIQHIQGAINRVPALEQTGIKSTVCGPESFTADHKPLLGESPEVRGFFLGCGFNSAGMMLGGGCGKELAHWIIHGRPEKDMYGYDIRRFHRSLTNHNRWIRERSHESYAKNYSVVFAYDEPLAGRNMRKDPLHEVLNGQTPPALDLERRGEATAQPAIEVTATRPAAASCGDSREHRVKPVTVQADEPPSREIISRHRGNNNQKKKRATFPPTVTKSIYGFPFISTFRGVTVIPLHNDLASHLGGFTSPLTPISFSNSLFRPRRLLLALLTCCHFQIRRECLMCRNQAAVFNMSYFGKFYLLGPDAKKAANWLFTADINKPPGTTVYTCILNKQGGAESDLAVSCLEPGTGGSDLAPQFEGEGYYLAIGGAVAQHNWSHISTVLQDEKFDCKLVDSSEDQGMISIQGPASRTILQEVLDEDLSNEAFPFSTHKLVTAAGFTVRAIRLSFVGEMGWELHMPREACVPVYKAVMAAGAKHGMGNAGYRAIDSLSIEKGYRHWHADLRPDDSPLEAGLAFTCKLKSAIPFLGRGALERQKALGLKKRLVCFTLSEKVPLFGLEAIWRNGIAVGHVRRADYGFTINKTIAYGYIRNPEGGAVSPDFVRSGEYKLERMGIAYPAEAHLKSPFDPNNMRVKGFY